MPALVPGVQPFAAFGGTYTLAADQESITIGASPAEAVVTPWYDMGSGATLARVQWDGTATGTIQGRTSAARPAASMAMGDACLILPGSAEWDASEYYDPGLGSLPGAVGWTDTVTGESLSGGYLTVPTSGTQKFRRYGNGIIPTGSKLIEINFRLSHESGTGDQGVFGMLPMGTGTYTGQTSFYLSLTNTGIVRNSGTTIYTIPGFAASTYYDFWLVFRTSSSGTRPPYYEVWYRAAGSYDQDDLTGFVLAGLAATSASNDFTALEFGGVWSGGTTCKWGKVRIFCAGSSVDEYGWETFSGSGDPFRPFVRNQRFWQVRGWQNGTLTGVDLASDLAAPGNPSGPEAAAVGASAIGGNCTSLASGAAAYYLELLDAGNGDAVIDARWELEPSATFRNLTAPGSFKIRTASASDDGVRGSEATTTSEVAVPAVAGAVALVLDDTTVTPGQTATLTPTITGSVTVTLDGNAMTNGVAANAVTGTAGALIGPTAPTPTVGWITYHRPTASWS
jgi:hypothetical protein